MGILFWQDFQSVVQTMRWEDAARCISDAELAEIENDIRKIRKLLDYDTDSSANDIAL